MKLVYATGAPRNFEFAVATRRESIPSGARVLAVCDGDRVEGHLDGLTFDRMSDEEYYAFQATVADARTQETSVVRRNGLARLLRRLLGR
jgi:hypothetical protein